MSLSRVVLGGLLALGIVGLSADAAQAQYYGANNYNNRFGGGGGRYYPSYSAPRQVYNSPRYDYTPYYAPTYYPNANRSYYNNYNSGYNNRYRGGSGYSFRSGFNNYRR